MSTGLTITDLSVKRVSVGKSGSEILHFPNDFSNYLKNAIESGSSTEDFDDKSTTTLLHYNVQLSDISNEYGKMISSIIPQLPKKNKKAKYAALYWKDSEMATCTLSIYFKASFHPPKESLNRNFNYNVFPDQKSHLMRRNVL